MDGLRKEIVNFAEKKIRTVKEIADQFEIADKQIPTLRLRLKSAKIKTKDTRGRKKIEF